MKCCGKIGTKHINYFALMFSLGATVIIYGHANKGSNREVLGSTPDRSTRIFFPSMPVSFAN